jgi:hypothetical protein
MPAAFTQRPPCARWMTYGLRPEPGRTWPRSSVRRAGFAPPLVVKNGSLGDLGSVGAICLHAGVKRTIFTPSVSSGESSGP